MTARNLRELGASPFPYIIPVVPRSLPTELIEGENFVLEDLLKLSLGSSSPAVSGQEDQIGAAIETLVRFSWDSQPQSSRLIPRPAKKKKENKTRDGKRTQLVPGWKTSWIGLV